MIISIINMKITKKSNTLEVPIVVIAFTLNQTTFTDTLLYGYLYANVKIKVETIVIKLDRMHSLKKRKKKLHI